MRIVNNLSRMTIYRNLLKDEIIDQYIFLLREFHRKEDKYKIEKIYYELIFKLNHIKEPIELQNNLLKSYIFRRIVEDNNIFAAICEMDNIEKEGSIYNQGLKDLQVLKDLIDYNIEDIQALIEDKMDYFSIEKSESDLDLIKEENYFIENMNREEVSESLAKYYKKCGYGKIGFYKAFTWKDKILNGVSLFDDISIDNLYCYENQRILLQNTKAFIEGKPANNILLVGARGTGKSSSVKALINYFYDSDLKLVEIYKDQLDQLSEILNILKDRTHKFVIFIDDLSFEENETNYKHMKSIIEGGVEKKPANILLYATSNRRHIIRETWSDRESDDIHSNDTVNEKLSLSDRFGITITFQSPNQEEYFEIVKGIAQKYNIDINSEEFLLEAKRWALSQNGRSGRTARQFVDNYLGQNL